MFPLAIVTVKSQLRPLTVTLYFDRSWLSIDVYYIQGGAKNGAVLSHCKYSENSMTDVYVNW